jgi:hypothetical protein
MSEVRRQLSGRIDAVGRLLGGLNGAARTELRHEAPCRFVQTLDLDAGPDIRPPSEPSWRKPPELGQAMLRQLVTYSSVQVSCIGSAASELRVTYGNWVKLLEFDVNTGQIAVQSKKTNMNTVKHHTKGRSTVQQLLSVPGAERLHAGRR